MSDFIEVYDGALSREFCKDFIELFEQNRQHHVDGRTGGGVDKSKKDSKDVYINQHPEYAQALSHILDATTTCMTDYFKKYHFALIGPVALTLQHPKTGEPVKVTHENYQELVPGREQALMQYLYRLGPINAQKYEVNKGGYPYWHSEIYPQINNTDALHRSLLFMFYLNDIDEGGETEFFYQKKKIKPKAGSMVIAPAGFTHTHRGNKPISGDKYILTSWVLFNQGEQIYR